MKFVVILCLIAYCDALPSEKRKEDSKTEKRALVEGNDAVQKRNPILDGASPSSTPGVIYAETKQLETDKSPSGEIYATPVPQVAKFSDVLTGHGPSFPTAIENHLYSPVQVYQPRLGSPTTYEVSAPIPAQLAYSETKTYSAPQNALQYNQQKPKQFAHVSVNYTPFQPQQPFSTPQQQLLPQQLIQQHSQPQFLQSNQQYIQQPIYHHQAPQFLLRVPYHQQPVAYHQQPVQYHQQPVQYQHQPVQYQQHPVQYQQQPVLVNQFPGQYNQQQTPFNHHSLSLIQPILEGITYAEQSQKAPLFQQAQRATTSPVSKITEKATLQPINDKQGAVSYASFSQSQPNYIQPSAPTGNYLPSAPVGVSTPRSPSSQLNIKQETPTNNIANPQPLQVASKPQVLPNLTYFRPHYFQSVPQTYFGPQESQSSGFAHPPLAISPTFPPIQYFGKFAPQIFGTYPQ